MTNPAIDTAVILAGGLGTRLRQAVPDLPKPLAPVDGHPFLEHLMRHWYGQGIRRFILSVGYKADLIRAAIGNRFMEATVEYVEETVPLGTGGGLLLALDQLPLTTAAVLLNGDTYFPIALTALADCHRRLAADWTLSTFTTSDKGRYLGLTVSAEGYIQAFGGQDVSGARQANGGVYLFRPEALNAVRHFAGRPAALEGDLFPSMLASGIRFAAFPATVPFIDIGIPEDYFRAPTTILAAQANFANRSLP